MVASILPLHLKDAVVKKRGKTILGPVNLELSGGGFTVIMGPNGAGKTTLLRLMHGLERLRNGSLDWNCSTSVARKKQAFVFQTPIMLRRTALENITYPLGLQGISKTEAQKQAQEWLRRTKLAETTNLQASFLSGGEKQKLAVARALACNPEVLFLDEPTANLDGRATREIEDILKNVLSSGIRIVMTTHDTGQAKRLADEVMFLYRGKLHEREPAKTFFAKQKTKEAKAFLNGDIVECALFQKLLSRFVSSFSQLPHKLPR
ncbi:MAG: ATP-binding cassette domain-containing protein [Pseudomonadota bacterium]